MEKEKKKRSFKACAIIGLVLTIIATITFIFETYFCSEFFKLKKDIIIGNQEQISGIGLVFIVLFYIIALIATSVLDIIGLSFSIPGIYGKKAIGITCVILNGSYIVLSIISLILISISDKII